MIKIHNKVTNNYCMKCITMRAHLRDTHKDREGQREREREMKRKKNERNTELKKKAATTAAQ